MEMEDGSSGEKADSGREGVSKMSSRLENQQGLLRLSICLAHGPAIPSSGTHLKAMSVLSTKGLVQEHSQQLCSLRPQAGETTHVFFNRRVGENETKKEMNCCGWNKYRGQKRGRTCV